MKLKHQQLLPNTSNAHYWNIFEKEPCISFTSLPICSKRSTRSPEDSLLLIPILDGSQQLQLLRKNACPSCQAFSSAPKFPYNFFSCANETQMLNFLGPVALRNERKSRASACECLKRHKSLKPHAWNFSTPSPCESIGIGNCKTYPFVSKDDFFSRTSSLLGRRCFISVI